VVLVFLKELLMSGDVKIKGPASYFPSIEAKYEKPMAYWFSLLDGKSNLKHMEMVNWLKAEHGMGHGAWSCECGHCVSLISGEKEVRYLLCLICLVLELVVPII
jgi:hypothetical protein